MSWLDQSIGEALDWMDEMNAGAKKIILSDEEGSPQAMMALVKGEQETSDVETALSLTEKAWHEKEDTIRDAVKELLDRAYGPNEGVPPDLARKIYDFLGEHRVLVVTRYGPVWYPPEVAETYDKDDQRDKIVDEINGSRFSEIIP